ncbi:MAG: hypothetical protein GX455_09450 [Phycisphaerae bacterium]|nr:hypothetical protein [Phycisphaerae bacterium]
MLSFLKDERNKNHATPPETADQPAAGENADGQVSREEDFLVPAEHGKNAKQSTFILVALFVIGALCVWFMIKKTTPNSANAAPNPEEAKIEEIVKTITGVKTGFSEVDAIVGRFSQISAVEQVNVTELKKNPFRRDVVLGTTEPAVPSASEQENWRREEVQRQAGKLQLFSIMNSTNGGCCMINDKLLNIGQSIEGFTVTKIEGDRVELTNNGVSVLLKMAP